ncbi:MAG: hypothetical protein ABDH29_06830 [Aquificaceae bacterium]
MGISELMELYERDYYEWLVSLKKYLETEDIIRYKSIHSQIKEYLLSISSSIKTELVLKITRYVYNSSLYEINMQYCGNTKQTKSFYVEKKKAELLLMEMVRDLGYLSTHEEWIAYLKERVFKILAEIISYNDESIISLEEFKSIAINKFNEILKILESYQDSGLSAYVNILIKDNVDYLEELLNDYNEFSIKFIEYAIDLGIKRTLRELKEYLADALLCIYKLKLNRDNETETWEKFNRDRLNIELSFSYAPSLKGEADKVLSKAQDLAKKFIEIEFGKVEKEELLNIGIQEMLEIAWEDIQKERGSEPCSHP